MTIPIYTNQNRNAKIGEVEIYWNEEGELLSIKRKNC